MTTRETTPAGTTCTWPGLVNAVNSMVTTGTWSALSDAARAVWLVLAKRADNRTGRCWPSVGTIAREAGKSRTQTYKALEDLLVARLVHRDSSTGGARTSTCTYTLLPVRPVEPVRPTEDLPVRPAGLTRPAHRTQIPHESPNESPNAQAAPAAGAGKPRGRDEIFETLAEVCGLPLDQLTKSARGQLNRAAKELRQLAAEPAEIRRRAAAYRETYPRASLTPNALVKHWPALGGNGARSADEFAISRREPTDADIAIVEAAQAEKARSTR